MAYKKLAKVSKQAVQLNGVPSIRAQMLAFLNLL